MYRGFFGKITGVLRDRKGIAAMEYAILGAAILAVVGLGAATLASDISGVLANLGAKILALVAT